MRTIFRFLLLIALVGTGYSLYIKAVPCARVISYSIGKVDERFGVSLEDFKSYVEESEKIWEEEIGKELFRYDEDASFEVNLIFDERQERTIEGQRDFELLEAEKKTLDEAETEYRERKEAFDTKKRQYESRTRTYDANLKKYNERVRTANSTGVSEEEYRSLEGEKATLDKEAAALERMRRDVNVLARSSNEAGTGLNDLVRVYNEHVQEFNRKYGESLEFNQGLYNGTNITIYQFTSPDDLITVLSHEFGHALGIKHVEDSGALMYYKVDSESKTLHSLTEADKGALRTACTPEKRLFEIVKSIKQVIP